MPTECEAERGHTGRGISGRWTGDVILSHDEDIERARRLFGHDKRPAGWRELDLRRAVSRERSDRAGDRAEPPVLRAEPGDTAAPRVDHVHEIVARGDADGLQAAGSDAIAPLQAVLRDLE